MKRILTSLERKAVFDNVGKTKTEFVICAVCSSKKLSAIYDDIDCVILCEDNNEVEEAERELRKKFPNNEIRVVKNRATRIE